MHAAAFHIIVIAVAAVAVVRGWRRGLSGQAASVLGFAFGTVCAHVMAPWAEAEVASWGLIAPHDCRAAFLTGTVARSGTYAVVYTVAKALTSIIERLLKPLGTGMLNSMAGSLFCLADWLMWTSIVLNLTLCAKPDCGLERCGDNGDGNVVAETMLFAPALLGGEDVCDLWHKCRLRDARLISGVSKEPVPFVESEASKPSSNSAWRKKENLDSQYIRCYA